MKRLGSIAAAATVLVAAAAFLFSGPGRPAVALGAADGVAPNGSVGGVRNPASGNLELRITASDVGSGLAGAEASLGSGPASYVRLGSGTCPEHPAPGSEPPPGAACPEAVSAVALSVDTHVVPDGEHRLRVLVTDGAGNTTTLVDETLVVRNAPHVSGAIATVAIGVGNQGEGETPEGGGGSTTGNDAVGLDGKASSSSLALQRKTCRSPRLRMRLASRPLWRTRPRHVPVLRFGGHYLYKGRLTCLVSGRRVPAAKGTPVNVFYRVWELTFKRHRGPVRKLRKRPIRVRAGGRLRVRLGGFRSGRTLYFRYRLGTATARAKVRVAVAPSGRLLPRWLR